MTVAAGESPKRLDQYLVLHERDLTRARAQRLIRYGRVRVNGQPAKPSHRIQGGDRITVETPPPTDLSVGSSAASLDIVYEDATVIVVNKPAGVPMHPGAGHWTGTVYNGLLAHWGKGSGNTRHPAKPFLVHRLDKETSGLVVIAKDRQAAAHLSEQFHQHRTQRTYLALVDGSPQPAIGTIQLALGRDVRDKKRVSGKSEVLQSARTDYRVVQTLAKASLIELTPRSGRTHQLRVHLQAIGHAILGDPLYLPSPTVSNLPSPGRLMLHALALGFADPATDQWRSFSVPLSTDMQRYMEIINDRAFPT
ncbi:MAG: RluA family pseudouridine synthase [Nitrospiraceae bacterium]